MVARGWVVTLLLSSLLSSSACRKNEQQAPAPSGSGAGSAAAPTGPWTLEQAAAPYRGVTLRTIGEALPPLEAMGKLAAEFEKQTGIKVVIEMYEHSEAVNKVMLDLNSKRGRYDFILQPHRELGRFVTNGHVVSVQPFLDDPALRDPSFDPAKVLQPKLWKEISWYDGKVYGFPFTALTMFLWYRKDLLDDPKEQAGFKAKFGYDLQVPKTWQQYTDAAAWFHRPEQKLYGTAIQGKRHEALWYEWLNFLYSFGGDMLQTETGSACGPVIVNSPQAIASLEYYKSLIKYAPPDTLNYFWDDVMALMQQGKVFELTMWNDATYAVEDPAQSKVAGKMGFATFPVAPESSAGKSGKTVGQIEGWSYLIPAESKNQRAAFLFIQWMMGFERQLAQHLGGGASARPDVYAQPAAQKLSYSQAALDTNAVAQAKPTLPQAPEITDLLTRELSLALTGAKTPKQALDTAAQEMSKLLGACAPMVYPVAGATP